MRRFFGFSVGLLLAGCGGAVLDETAGTELDTDTGSVEVVDSAVADADASAAEKADAAGLTAAQARTVLQAIDNHCGDTWCEGDLNFHFRRIVCDFGQKRCTLTMYIDVPTDPESHVWRSCRLSGVTRYSSMVRTTGGYTSLQSGFQTKMDQCITRVEGSISY